VNKEVKPQSLYRILIADDHSIVRRGIRTLLNSQPGIEVCGEACNGREALDLVKTRNPDLILMDLTMPDMDGLEAIEVIAKSYPGTKVLVVTMHHAEGLVREAIRLGVRGYVVKSDADPELVAAIAQIRQGGTAFSSQITESMARSFTCDQPSGKLGAPAGAELTTREREVIRLLATGRTNKEVATDLRLSVRTAESHRNHVMQKLELSSFSDLVRFAVRAKLIEP
jgi:DNA-binding NarL/FixJ family response regulator